MAWSGAAGAGQLERSSWGWRSWGRRSAQLEAAQLGAEQLGAEQLAVAGQLGAGGSRFLFL
jgi:hypothetical protein